MNCMKKIKRRLIKYKNDLIKHYINFTNLIRFAVMENHFGVYKGTPRREMIIVSLTSFPARMNKIHLCLKSLLLQETKPDRIIVWLGEDEFKGLELPKKVSELTKYGVEFRFCPDIKPHTKYFYCCQEYPNACIITVDDDVYYSKKLVGDLYEAHLKHQNTIVCTRAHKMRLAGDTILPYNEWDYETKDITDISHMLMATGVGGVLYPPNSLPRIAFDKEAIEKYCLKADDVWLKAMEILQGTKVCAIPSTKTKYVVGIWGSEKIALFKSNVGQNQNDQYIRNTFGAYGITAELIREKEKNIE